MSSHTRRAYQLCGIGNGIMDVVLEVADADLAALGLVKGSTSLVSVAQQQSWLKRLSDRPLSLVSGGSLANSMIAFAQLGGRGAFITRLGDDPYGAAYRQEFADLGIEVPGALAAGEVTGTCLSLVAPDAERTMRTNLGASERVGADLVDEQIIAAAEWVVVEGYLLSSPEFGQPAARRAFELAARHGCKVAVTASALFIVEGFGTALKEAMRQTDLLFANREEALGLTGESDIRRACGCLGSAIEHVVITCGAEGVVISRAGDQCCIPALPCEPRDLTGAGDMFAGAYLYGITHGIAPELSARGACRLSKEVIMRVGARLPQGVRGAWDEALACA